MILVKDQYQVTEIKSATIPRSSSKSRPKKFFQYTTAKIEHVVYVAVYANPSNKQTDLISGLKKIIKEFPETKLIIGGDFNFDIKKKSGFENQLKNLKLRIVSNYQSTTVSGKCIDFFVTNIDDLQNNTVFPTFNFFNPHKKIYLSI
jgi:hypothetical protein